MRRDRCARTADIRTYHRQLLQLVSYFSADWNIATLVDGHQYGKKEINLTNHGSDVKTSMFSNSVRGERVAK